MSIERALVPGDGQVVDASNAHTVWHQGQQSIDDSRPALVDSVKNDRIASCFRLERPRLSMIENSQQDHVNYLRAMAAFKEVIRRNDWEEDAFGFYTVRVRHEGLQRPRFADEDSDKKITGPTLGSPPTSLPTPVLHSQQRTKSYPRLLTSSPGLKASHISDQAMRPFAQTFLPNTSSTMMLCNGTIVPVLLVSGCGVLASNPEFAEMAQILAKYQHGNSEANIALNPPEISNLYVPSNQLQMKYGRIESPLSESKYKGSLYSKSKRAQYHDLPDVLNCALWLTSLPTGTTAADLLREVHTGAVYAVHINDPDGSHHFCAAKLVFMRHVGAARFLKQVYTTGVHVAGQRIRAIYNRYGHRDYPHPEKSRVLRISGPAAAITRQFWDKYLNKCAVFQLSGVRQFADRGGDMGALEYAFARFDGQAEACYYAIKKEPKFSGVVKVSYIHDPCDILL